MNKFIIDEAANELLECWRISHADSIRSCITEAVWYFDRFELVYRSKEREISGFCERHKKFFEVKLYEQGVRTATLKLRASEKPGEDVTMQMVPNKSLVNMDDPEQRESMQRMLQQVARNALTVNALLIVGNLVEPSNRVVSANSVRYKDGDRTFVFRPYKDTCYAVASGSHRAPEGAFPVRGHFRRYKDGKVVWIESYMKGVE